MDGVPVFLASLSRKSLLTGRFVPTGRWSDSVVSESIRLLREVLATRGDPTRERLFRMNVTLCLHRAMSPTEIAGLAVPFRPEEAVDLAGGPIEVLWESVPGSPSTRPCANPRRRYLDPGQPELWVPLDCGECDSCHARAKIAGPQG